MCLFISLTLWQNTTIGLLQLGYLIYMYITLDCHEEVKMNFFGDGKINWKPIIKVPELSYIGALAF